MSLLLFILLLGFVLFILWPIIRVWMAIRSAKQKAKNYFNGNSNGARNTERRYSRESAPSYRPKRKIIDPNIGEYVEFEELRTYTSDTTCNTSDTTIKYKEEEQIEDAVWEEIKK